LFFDRLELGIGVLELTVILNVIDTLIVCRFDSYNIINLQVRGRKINTVYN